VFGIIKINITLEKEKKYLCMNILLPEDEPPSDKRKARSVREDQVTQ
jgi:hypothetical protein